MFASTIVNFLDNNEINDSILDKLIKLVKENEDL